MRQSRTERWAGLGGATVIAIALSSAVAQATELDFDFNYDGIGVSASGVLITDDVLTAGAYTVIGITGARNSVPITSIVAPGGLGGNDNLLFPGPPFVDYSGITYSAGGVDYNFYETFTSAPGCQNTLEISSVSSSPICGDPIEIDLTVNSATTTTPEPWSASLLAVGLAGLAFLRQWTERIRGYPSRRFVGL